DLERDARAVRRAAPPLPLPLCRLPERGQGAAHRAGARAGHRDGAGPADRPLRPGAAPRGATQEAGHRRDPRLGCGPARARGQGPPRRSRSALRHFALPAEDPPGSRDHARRHGRAAGGEARVTMSSVLAWPERPDGTPVVQRIVGFVRLLRDNGFRVGLAETRDAVRLARSVDLSRPDPLRQGLRALLCGSPADWARYDELFEAWWL